MKVALEYLAKFAAAVLLFGPYLIWPDHYSVIWLFSNLLGLMGLMLVNWLKRDERSLQLWRGKS